MLAAVTVSEFRMLFRQLVSNQWDQEIVPQLIEYIRLPCKSPHFDPHWQSNGHIDAAVTLAERWCRAQPIAGLRLEVLRLDGRTPLLFFEVPGDAARTVLLYGHLDKQPEMVGWRENAGPWTPVIEGRQAVRPRRSRRRLRCIRLARARCSGCMRRTSRMRAAWA